MPAHNAPLGVDFFRGQSCDVGEGAFPCNSTGAAVVAFHGMQIAYVVLLKISIYTSM